VSLGLQLSGDHCLPLQAHRVSHSWWYAWKNIGGSDEKKEAWFMVPINNDKEKENREEEEKRKRKIKGRRRPSIY
jgi:hypothetical protein